MTTSSTATASRQVLRQHGQPPRESGERIRTIRRSPTEEIRIAWDQFEGNPYLSLRMWVRNQRGEWWPDQRRYLSIRLRELDELAEAVVIAQELRNDLWAQDRRAGAPEASARDRSRHRFDPATLPFADPSAPASAAEFSEFETG